MVLTGLLLSLAANGEPQINDKLTVTGDGQVNFEAGFSLFGRGQSGTGPTPRVVLPPIKATPPSSFTDSDTFFKSVGKESQEPTSNRRYR